MSVFSTLSSLGIQKTCQRKAQLKAQASQSPWRWSQRLSAKWHLAKQPDHQVLSLRCWSPLGNLAQWRCVISLRTSSRRDAFQLTGRKASLSIYTRAKEMLWTEATTGAWSWLSKWWRCWSMGGGTHQAKSWDQWDAVWLHVWPWHYWCNFYCTSATGEALGCQQAALHGLRRPGESIWSSSTGCHLVGNAQTRNWRVVGHHVWGVSCCMQQRLGPWRWIHWTVSGVMTVPWSVGSAMSGQRTKLAQTLLTKLGIQDLDVVLRTSRMRWFGHVERSTGWIAEVRKLNVVAQKRSSRPRKSWDEVLENDRKKLGMDSADPQNRSEWRGRLQESLVKKPNPR